MMKKQVTGSQHSQEDQANQKNRAINEDQDVIDKSDQSDCYKTSTTYQSGFQRYGDQYRPKVSATSSAFVSQNKGPQAKQPQAIPKRTSPQRLALSGEYSKPPTHEWEILVKDKKGPQPQKEVVDEVTENLEKVDERIEKQATHKRASIKRKSTKQSIERNQNEGGEAAGSTADQGNNQMSKVLKKPTMQIVRGPSPQRNEGKKPLSPIADDSKSRHGQSRIKSESDDFELRMKEKIDQLEEGLEDIVVKFDRSFNEFEKFKEQFISKATEKNLAIYLKKICEGLQKECGERPYQDKLQDQLMFKDMYQSEDSVALKDAVNEMQDKFQIIGMNLIQTKKFKKDAQHRIYHLEERHKTFIDIHKFQKETEAMEDRLRDFTNQQMRTIQTNLNQLSQHLSEQVKYFDEKTTEIQQSTIWKIKDVENLLTARISEQKVEDLINQIHKKIRAEMMIEDGKLSDKVVEIQQELNNKVDKFLSVSEMRMDKLHLEVHIFKEDIENTVKKDDYIQTVAKLDDLQRGLEGELDNIQSHVRENKDKQQELIKRFQQLVESDKIQHAILENSSEQIIGLSSRNTKQQLSTQGLSPTKLVSRNYDSLEKGSQPELRESSGSCVDEVKDVSKNLQQHGNTIDSRVSGGPQGAPGDKKLTKKTLNLLSMSNQQSRQFLMSKIQGNQARISQDAMTSKERHAFFNMKISRFEEIFAQIEDHFKNLQIEMDMKVDKDLVEIIRDDKVSKADFIKNIPNYLSEENIHISIKKTCDALNDELRKQFDDLQRLVDQRLVSIRQDFDMNALKRSIDKKSEKTDMLNMFENHDQKLLTLDNNFLLLAQDLETFQKFMNRQQKSIAELQEVNKDVLLGKKNVSCLSCNKGEDVRGPVQHVKGQDGKLYWGGTSQAHKKRASAVDGYGHGGGIEQGLVETIDEPTNFRSGSPKSSHQQMVGSRSNVFKNNSVSISMGNYGQIQLTDENSNSLSRAGLINRGIGLKRQGVKSKQKIETDNNVFDKKYELRQQIEGKGKQHKRSNTSAQQPFRVKQQSKLPIGYRVQQEKRSELQSRASHFVNINSGAMIDDMTNLSKYHDIDETMLNRYSSQISQTQLLFNKVQRTRPMTGKAQIVNSSFGGSSNLNALRGSRDVVGQSGFHDSMVGLSQPQQLQSMTQDQIQYENNFHGSGISYQAQNNLTANYNQENQRQFSAVQFRKNENSLGNLAQNNGSSAIGEVNVRITGIEKGNLQEIQGSIPRGNSQLTFPSQNMNLGALSHQQQPGFISETHKGQTPVSASGGNNATQHHNMNVRSMSEESNTMIMHYNPENLAHKSSYASQQVLNDETNPSPQILQQNYTNLSNMQLQKQVVMGSEEPGIEQAYDFEDGQGKEGLRSVGFGVRDRIVSKGRITQPSSELRTSTNMDARNADILNDRTGDGVSSNQQHEQLG